MTDNHIFNIAFGGEEIHNKTFGAMLIVALGGYVFGTIRPSVDPWWGTVLKVVIGAGLVVAALRYHPGAERVALDWVEYKEADG